MLVASGRSAFIDVNGTDAYKIPFSKPSNRASLQRIGSRAQFGWAALVPERRQRRL